jgi:hypothetical protein
MANKTIPDLTAGAAVGAADLFEASQSAASVKITAAQLLTYVSANLDATLVAVAAVTFAANKGLYATGADAFATYDLTAGGRALGGVAGTADTFPYFSASNTVTLASITAAGRALLDDADAAAQRATLGVNPSRIDPTNPTITVDEFEFASTETGEIGEMGWGFTNGTFNLVNPESGHPGTCRRASTAVAATVASVFPGGGGATPTHRFDQIDEQTWIIKPVTADTDYDLRFGWSSDFTSATASNGVYFEKLAADTNWFGVSRTSGSQTRTDLGVAFAASWFKLRMRRIDASTVGFSINGGSETTIAATIPPGSNVLLFGFHIIPQSANARSVDVDWYGHRLVAQSR